MTRIHLPAVLALGLCAASAGPLQAEPADATVAVHAGGFAWAGETFADLATLEATLMPRAPRSVTLHACGVEAVPGWKAAAYRFRHLALDLAVADAAASACRALPPAALVPVLQRTGGDAVDRWWAQLQP